MMMLSPLAGLAVDEVEEVEAMATRLLFPVAGWMTMTTTIASHGARITATEAALATQTMIAITIAIEREEEGEERRTEIVTAVDVATGIARAAVIATVSENVKGTATETEAIAEWVVIVTMTAIVIVTAATGSLLQRAEQAQPIEDAARRVTRTISLTAVVEVKIMSRRQQKPRSSPSTAVAVEAIAMMRTTMRIAEREALRRIRALAIARGLAPAPGRGRDLLRQISRQTMSAMMMPRRQRTILRHPRSLALLSRNQNLTWRT